MERIENTLDNFSISRKGKINQKGGRKERLWNVELMGRREW